MCVECTTPDRLRDWPCLTIRLLDGEDPEPYMLDESAREYVRARRVLEDALYPEIHCEGCADYAPRSE